MFRRRLSRTCASSSRSGRACPASKRSELTYNGALGAGVESARSYCLLCHLMREVGKLLLMVVAVAISVAVILFVMDLLGLQPRLPL